MKAVVIIPARYASTRLPGKPLADICGKPMLQRVWEIAIKAALPQAVYIATDDEKVAVAAESWGAKVLMTSADCSSGTERLLECVPQVDADIYINLQGDEPLMKSEAIDLLIKAFAEPSVRLASLYCPMGLEDARLPQNVKVVLDHMGNALYYSRALIPFPREKENTPIYKCHLGIYAYRKNTLEKFKELLPSPLEKLEQLEQLRFLQAGISIKMLEVEAMGGGVDTADDLEKTRAIVREAKEKLAKKKLKNIKLLVTDVDGVLTDGSLYYGPNGEEIKKFNAKDGGAIKELQKMGIEIAILSGRSSQALMQRAKDLAINEVTMGSHDKGRDLRALMNKLNVNPENTAYIGDDYPDLPAFEAAGIAVVVADANSNIKNVADIVLKNSTESNFAQILNMLIK